MVPTSKKTRTSRLGEALAIILLACGPPQINAQIGGEWKELERVRFDWREKGKYENFIVELREGGDTTGFITRLRILSKGRKPFILTYDDQWVDYKEEIWTSERPPIPNLVRSKYLLFLPAPESAPVRAFVVLFGWVYASSPGSVQILGARTDGTPILIFRQENFYLQGYKDLDGDSLPEIIGLPCFSQTWGQDFLTYDPVLVYTFLNSRTDRLFLSRKLSKSYNLQHYYGWAGLECREDVAVVPDPKNPKRRIIVPAKEAEAFSNTKGIGAK